MLALDHLAVLGETLEAAVSHAEAALGVTLDPGGAHPAMGTHNRLIALGPGVYLEAIAIDPAAPAPARARWFGLDDFRGPARLGHWIARTDDLNRALAEAPAGLGTPLALCRGDLAWTMAVPETGHLPFEGAAPALIEWRRGGHPADLLPDRGLWLEELLVTHPDPAGVLAAFPALAGMPQVVLATGPAPGLAARIRTPDGIRVLT